MNGRHLAVSLDAVVLAVTDETPRVLVTEDGGSLPALPSGPLDVDHDATLERGLRRYVREQTGLELGYVEQLYTFGDRDRAPDADRMRRLSVGYLALVQETAAAPGTRWADVHEFLPWEDHRDGSPEVVDDLRARLASWAGTDRQRQHRITITFGPPWDGIRALERYELLYGVGLVDERAHDDHQPASEPGVGRAMRDDHRRILATAIGRIRGKLTYRPIVFELVAEPFTLLELQRTVEALSGVGLHKQNFRRLVLGSGLVEGTGETRQTGAGRPAQLFRYRPEVQLERPRPGLGQPYR
ncbi:MAG: hypothetical protein EA340_08780 [Nitriliruptor sp.]|nr:MAG: hypothetical protein EA340_08780 [Nitriliruptor sp.]